MVQQSLRTQLVRQFDAGGEAEDIVRNVRESLEYIKQLSPGIQEIVRVCYGKATQHGFWFSMSLAVAAAFSSCKVTWHNVVTR